MSATVKLEFLPICEECGWRGKPTADSDFAYSQKVAHDMEMDSDVDVSTFTSDLDGVLCVQIDTWDVPQVRVFLNDDPIWGRSPVTPCTDDECICQDLPIDLPA